MIDNLITLVSFFFTSGGNLILLALILKSVKWLQNGFFFWNDVFLLGTGFQVKIFQIEHFSGNPAGRGRIVEINGGI